MAKKYYAVKNGRKTGVFETWDECKSQVAGFSGATYKSFLSKDEALKFINEEAIDYFSDEEELAGEAGQSEVFAYVDGSYDDITKSYSYGMVIIYKDDELYFSKKFEKDRLSSMRNVAGEIRGAMAAMQYCLDNGIKSISIFYDYEGIEKWCSGAWKATKEGTKKYAAFYKEISKYLDVDFIKVKGHSGDKYNDMADALAKEALGILKT